MTTRIVAAAIRANGLTMSQPAPARHCDILAAMPAKMASAVTPFDQGFIDSEGSFLHRGEALVIARLAGQLLNPTSHSELFSEDLW